MEEPRLANVEDGRNPVPPRHDATALQKKFADWLKLKEVGMSFNQALLDKRPFHNPNISHLMVKHVELDEHGTNFRMPEEDEYDKDYDYAKVAADQRTAWEKTQPPSSSASNFKEFVPPKTKTEYAAIMQQRYKSGPGLHR